MVVLVASPLAASVFGIGTAPPGDVGNLAVNTSTPSSVTSNVCSVNYVSMTVRNKRAGQLGSSITIIEGKTVDIDTDFEKF